ncbi:WD40 repeat-like protein [Obba rivulosa]|uniref:WD40 repeat-like protein n=1 Tax=Obba rivulosa TaxID=1052685 RepID=A0A8E2ATN8_9APHY|nr:WD40 repeat-like protein [Obba rivulosa]
MQIPPADSKYLILDVKRSSKSHGSVHIYVSIVRDDEQKSANKKADSKVDAMKEAVQRAQTKIGKLAESPSYDRFKEVLTGLDIVIKFTEPLSEFPVPGLKTAHELLSKAYEVFNSQKERDENVENLAVEMAQLWTILSEIQNLEMIKSMKEVFDAVAEVTEECAGFLDKYAENNFAQRLVKGYFVLDGKISSFRDSFSDLKERLVRGTSIQTWVTVEREFRNVNAKLDLQTLVEADGASFDKARICLPNTRERDLERILTWVDNKSACGVYWLTGVAGCGKSTIAHTVAERLDEGHRLGASFFFSRTHDLDDPHLFCTTIARQLARYNPMLRQAILEAITKDPGIAKKPFTSQMGPLISEAILKARLSLPPVIVIDSLDESGSPEIRGRLMTMLRLELPKLAARAKIFITSRDEPDIRGALPALATRQPHRADLKGETRADVRRFIQSQLSEVVLRFPYLQDWPSTKDINKLTYYADGLFVWASVACDFILNGPDQDPVAQLETIVSADPAERAKAESSLDALYLAILRRRPIDRDAFRYVIGSILTLGEPLSPRDLDKLLELNNVTTYLTLVDGTKLHLTSCQGLVASLASILRSDGPDRPTRIVHASVFDFFVSRERSQEFYIDPQLAHFLLFDRCMTRMRDLLQHDICDLQDPSKLNSDIPDIDARVARSIPTDLRYACRFWASHLSQVGSTQTSVGSSAREFLSQHLLHWLEVMSLLRRTREVGPMLRAVETWSKVSNLDELSAFASDCLHFSREFSPMMEASALHIYISAMLFCPRNSRVFKAYRNSSPIQLPAISCADDVLTTPICSVYQGHSEVIYAAAFFPSGDKVVSGGAGRTIQIWDPTSGSLVQDPLQGYRGSVLSLAVSSDGGLVAAATAGGMVHLWNTSTGKRAGEPLHVTQRVTGVVFLAQDALLASSSADGLIRIWDVQKGALARAPLAARSTPLHVAVSPDGKVLAAVSRDSAELWDVATWESKGDPLQPGDSAVAFSPDSQRLALGRYTEHCAFLWDLPTRQYKRLDGHTKTVSTVAFSPDGKLLASGSSDAMVRLWDGITGEPLHVLRGHSYTVWSVAFSPDGAQLATASADKTVRVWDVESLLVSGSTEARTDIASIDCVACSPTSKHLAFTIGNIVYITSANSSITPLRRHTEEVKYLGFSPDGSRLASASKDLLQWWNAKTISTLDSVSLVGSEKARLIEMSPDSSRLALILDPQTVVMCSTTNGEPVGEPRTEHEGWIRSVTFSPDGSWLATSADDYTIRLRDPASGAEVGDSIHTPVRVSALVFAQSGSRLVSGSLDATIRVWSTSSRELLWQYSGDAAGKIYKIVSTPDNRQLIYAAASGAAVVLDASSGTRVGKAIRCFNGVIRSLAISHDSTDLVAATDTIQIWTKKGDDAWAFRQELYPTSEMFWRKDEQPSGPFLASFHEHPDGWLTCSEGHRLLWLPEHLRRVWSPFQTSRLRLGQDTPTVTLDLHDYLVWLSGITRASYEVDE